MSRQIVLDTETTGLQVENGHRLIEIACLELINRRLTGRSFHCYLNPECEVDPEALAVHGLTNDFLADKPKFLSIANDFIQFIENAELIIHNAPFDIGFLNAELHMLMPRQPEISILCSSVIDTLTLARSKHPGQANSLDALCRRYQIDNSNRELHGALIDAELLAHVYLRMTGGQIDLFIGEQETILEPTLNKVESYYISKEGLPLRVVEPNAAELQAHQLFLEAIHKQSGVCLWLDD